VGAGCGRAAQRTLDHLVQPVLELCDFDVVAWRLTPRQLDQYFAGPGKRASSTMRSKSNKIDHYFTFLEQRYAGEILRRFGVAVELRSTSSTGRSTAATSGCGCRPRSGRRGSSSRDGGNRWRPPRKPVVARRDYVMGKLAFISGVRRPSSAG
jgi:hypothetical protein